MSPSATLVDKVSGALASRFSRRGFFARSAVVGSAIAANPLTYALTPTDAYAAVCSCSGSNCDCGSTCCDGYTEFCCTLTGANQCPPGSLLGGWWKVDGTGFCSGPRYYMDCNAPCNGCGCGGGGICSGGCSGTNCGCGLGDCNNRKAGCVNFRYGQCNQQTQCIGPIVCRVVTCIAPWEIDATCTTTARYDANTAFHDRPCLHNAIGDVNGVAEVATGSGPGIRVTGWALDVDTNSPIDVHVYVDGQWATSATASVSRPDIAAAFPGQGPNHGFDVVVPAGPGTHQVCVYAINTGPSGNGNPPIGCRSIRLGSPFGNLDGWALGPSGVTLTGWAIDPDTPNPIDVHIYVDGTWAGQATASVSRPDVAQAYPAAGPNHGFNVTVPLAAGRREVCVYAINVANGSMNPKLGCATVVAGNPLGNLESVVPSAAGVLVGGWAFDPDQPTTALDVTIKVDGVTQATFVANESRPDVGQVYPLAGSLHGFSGFVDVAPGTHTVTAVAGNVGQGADSTVGSRRVEVRTGAPFGNLESVVAGPQTARVSGWVLDPDSTGSISARIEVDGATATTVTANRPRPDVEAIYPGYGSVHGFQADISLAAGFRVVRVVALNVGAGSDSVVGSRQVLIGGSPFGNVDDVAVTGGTAVVTGWAIDPDTSGPVEIHLYVDGGIVLVGSAGLTRSDVGAAYPLYGPGHGFRLSIPLSPGRHQVCAYAINAATGSNNPVLGCRTVTA